MPVTVSYKAGAPIIREGDEGNEIFWIRQGTVRIHRRAAATDHELAVLSADDIFGEMAAISRQPRSASATALTDTVIYRIHQDELRQELDAAGPFIRHLCRNLITKLHSADERIVRHV